MKQAKDQYAELKANKQEIRGADVKLNNTWYLNAETQQNQMYDNDAQII